MTDLPAGCNAHWPGYTDPLRDAARARRRQRGLFTVQGPPLGNQTKDDDNLMLEFRGLDNIGTRMVVGRLEHTVTTAPEASVIIA